MQEVTDPPLPPPIDSNENIDDGDYDEGGEEEYEDYDHQAPALYHS